MTIDDAIYLEDALDMQARGVTKEQFVGCPACSTELPAALLRQAVNAQAAKAPRPSRKGRAPVNKVPAVCPKCGAVSTAWRLRNWPTCPAHGKKD